MMRKEFAIFALESLIAGFYVAITRGLAPLFLTVYGMSISEILKLNLVANAFALAAAWLLYLFRGTIISKGLKHKLVLSHALERFIWGSIPVAAIYYPGFLYAVYTIAVVSTVPVGFTLYMAMNSTFDEDSLKRVYAYRSALGSMSTLAGQATSIIVVATMEGVQKYVLLYVMAMAIGLLASAVLASASIKSFTPVAPSEVPSGIEVAKASTTFTYLMFLVATGSVLGVAWTPYLVEELRAEEYIAVALGLAQTLTSVVASVFWTTKGYATYRYAVSLLPVVPITILYINVPMAHLAIAVLYAFANIGANFLASFTFAEVAKRFSADRASAMLTAASIPAQVMGIGIAYVASLYGAYMPFVTSAMLASVALLIAFTAMPGVAVVQPQLSMMYAMQIHHTATALYNFVFSTVKSYATLSARLVALASSIIVLYTAFRLLYYLVQILAGAVS